MENSQANDLVLQNASRELGLRRFKFTTAGLVFVFALGNTFLPSMFCDTEPEMMYFPLSFFGICVTQIVLLGIWAALGTMAIKYRFPLTLGLAIFLAMSYVLGLRIPDGSMPGGIALMLIAFAVLVYFALFVVQRLVRRQTGMHLLILGNQPAIVGQRSKQVSVGYLLGATTFVAFVITGLRLLVPSIGVFSGPPLWTIFTNGLFFAFAYNSIAIGSVLVIFSQTRIFWLIVLFALTLVLPWLQLLVAGFRFPSAESVAMSYSFFLGHEISLLLALYLVRCSGVSLMVESPGQPK